jgi:hypothetical protein
MESDLGNGGGVAKAILRMKNKGVTHDSENKIC